jgi:DNA-binding CsgD family transcriptional regulator/pimeloyl-ACP methyl ester carboxylesterase
MDGLARRFQVIQHDMYGHGMSERGLPPDFATGVDERAVDAVVDRLELDRFILFGLGGVGHLGVRYAAAHPERVEALILNGTTVSVVAPSFYQGVAAENWEFFLRSFVPASVGTDDAQGWYEILRESTTYADWQIRSRVVNASTISDSLTEIRVPTLALHAAGRALVPSEGAVRLAALIAGAQLAILSGDHPLGDATQGLAAIDRFIAELPARPDHGASTRVQSRTAVSGLSPRQREVLGLIAQGKTNREIAEVLVLSERTIQRHIADLYLKIDVRNRAEATSFALNQVT